MTESGLTCRDVGKPVGHPISQGAKQAALVDAVCRRDDDRDASNQVQQACEDIGVDHMAVQNVGPPVACPSACPSERTDHIIVSV